MEYAPLRTLDDFLLESARFQIPNFSDWEKWGNRIVSNLLYYQTNYFLMSIIIFILFGVMHPVQIITGFLVMLVIFTVFCYVTNEAGAIGQFKCKHPVVSTGLIFTVSYYLLATVMGSLLVFLLSILVPFCSIFIHSSLRLRNVKNKLANTFEPMGVTRTPMGIFLEEMGLQVKIF